MEQADDLERKLADGELDPATGKPWCASKRKRMEATLKNTLARQDKIQTKIAELKIKLTESELKMTEIDKAAGAKPAAKDSGRACAWTLEEEQRLIRIKDDHEAQFKNKIDKLESNIKEITATNQAVIKKLPIIEAYQNEQN